MNDRLTLNLTLGQRLVFFLCATLLCLVLVSILSGMIVSFKGQTSATLRIAAVLQDLFVFIVPAIATAMISTRLSARFLCIDSKPAVLPTVLACLVLVVALPAMNWIVQWNEAIELPESLQTVDNWMRAKEIAARESINVLIGGSSAGSLIISLLIVAVFAGFSEELFFRGAFQRLLTTGGVNVHVAIWLVAFIFSAIHFQFYGFFGRFILGAYFGYLLYWTRVLWIPIIAHIFNNSLYIIGNYQLSNNADGINPNGTGGPIMVVASVILTALLVTFLYLRVCKKS